MLFCEPTASYSNRIYYKLYRTNKNNLTELYVSNSFTSSQSVKTKIIIRGIRF